MHKIDSVGSVNGTFVSGSPQTGQKPTRFSADWLNEVQSEVISVLTAANIAPSKGTVTQLRDAIIAIVGGAVGTGTGSVPTSRQVSGGGLVTGGGPLVGNLTLSVAKALAADIVAGTSDVMAMTPLGFASAFGDGSTGYVRLPGGTILQKGVGFVSANASTLVSLPISFTTECFFAGITSGEAVGNAQDNNPFVSGVGISTFSVFSAINTGLSFNWFAWGK